MTQDGLKCWIRWCTFVVLHPQLLWFVRANVGHLLHVLTVCLCTTKKCFYHAGAYLQVPWRILAVLCGVQATQVLTHILCHVGRRKAEYQPWRMIPLRYLCYKCLFTEWPAMTQLLEQSIFFSLSYLLLGLRIQGPLPSLPMYAFISFT
jgi:hypothetical protein